MNVEETAAHKSTEELILDEFAHWLAEELDVATTMAQDPDRDIARVSSFRAAVLRGVVKAMLQISTMGINGELPVEREQVSGESLHPYAEP